MIFRRKYSLFYFLTFMSGARRQIFVAFAVFLLVKNFGFTVQDITFLFVINNAVNYFLSPFIGKCIIRFGERKVLSLEYFSLIFIFLAYSTVTSKTLVGILYILDHIFFNFAIAIRTYFRNRGTRGYCPEHGRQFHHQSYCRGLLSGDRGIAVDGRLPDSVYLRRGHERCLLSRGSADQAAGRTGDPTLSGVVIPNIPDSRIWLLLK